MVGNEIITNFVVSKDKRTLTDCLTQNLQKMSDGEFEKEVRDLVEMLNNLHRIRDKGLRKWLKAEIRYQLIKLLED